MDFFFSSSDSQEWPLVWRTVSLIILQELDSVIASPVSRTFWVRLGPTLIGSRFSRASRCGPVNEEDSSCPSRMRSERPRCREGGGRGRGLVCYSRLKMEPKIEGSATRRAGLGRSPFSPSLTFGSCFFSLPQHLCCCLLGSPPHVHVTFHRWHPLGVSLSLHRALCLGEVGNPSARLRGIAPRWKIREGTLPNGLDRCCATRAALHRTLSLPSSLALVLILHQIYFGRVTPKIHRHTWALSQAGVPAYWLTEFQLCKLENKKTKQLNRH